VGESRGAATAVTRCQPLTPTTQGGTVPVHPQAQMVLDFMADTGFTFEGLTADELRARANMAVPSPIELPSITDRTVPGPAGDIPVRIYRPSDEVGLPVVVFFHGGGWVIGDLESHDHMARAIASKADCVVVAVDYRLAPEHKFPAAADDAWAALEYVATHADELGVDAARIAVAGDSAGGNLAAVVSVQARDAEHVEVIQQVLLYPVTDGACDRPSMTENAEGYMLTRGAMDWFHEQYAGSEDDLTDPRYSPIYGDLAGVAPAVVVTAEFDPLRDQGEAYAVALTDAGVDVVHTTYEGMIHGFFSMDAGLDSAGEAQDAVAAALKQAFAA
jgi:acetyl esterase